MRAAEARRDAEEERAGVTALQNEEEAGDRRCSEIADEIAAAPVACVADVLVKLELLTDYFKPDIDDEAKPLLESIIAALRALAGGPAPSQP